MFVVLLINNETGKLDELFICRVIYILVTRNLENVPKKIKQHQSLKKPYFVFEAFYDFEDSSFIHNF